MITLGIIFAVLCVFLESVYSVSCALYFPPGYEVPYRPAVDDDDQWVTAVEVTGLQSVGLEELYSAGILYILPMRIHPEHGFRLIVCLHLQPQIIVCNRVKQTLSFYKASDD